MGCGFLLESVKKEQIMKFGLIANSGQMLHYSKKQCAQPTGNRFLMFQLCNCITVIIVTRSKLKTKNSILL